MSNVKIRSTAMHFTEPCQDTTESSTSFHSRDAELSTDHPEGSLYPQQETQWDPNAHFVLRERASGSLHQSVLEGFKDLRTPSSSLLSSSMIRNDLVGLIPVIPGEKTSKLAPIERRDGGIKAAACHPEMSPVNPSDSVNDPELERPHRTFQDPLSAQKSRACLPHSHSKARGVTWYTHEVSAILPRVVDAQVSPSDLWWTSESIDAFKLREEVRNGRLRFHPKSVDSDEEKEIQAHAKSSISRTSSNPSSDTSPEDALNVSDHPVVSSRRSTRSSNDFQNMLKQQTLMQQQQMALFQQQQELRRQGAPLETQTAIQELALKQAMANYQIMQDMVDKILKDRKEEDSRVLIAPGTELTIGREVNQPIYKNLQHTFTPKLQDDLPDDDTLDVWGGSVKEAKPRRRDSDEISAMTGNTDWCPRGQDETSRHSKDRRSQSSSAVSSGESQHGMSIRNSSEVESTTIHSQSMRSRTSDHPSIHVSKRHIPGNDDISDLTGQTGAWSRASSKQHADFLAYQSAKPEMRKIPEEAPALHLPTKSSERSVEKSQRQRQKNEESASRLKKFVPKQISGMAEKLRAHAPLFSLHSPPQNTQSFQGHSAAAIRQISCRTDKNQRRTMESRSCMSGQRPKSSSERGPRSISALHDHSKDASANRSISEHPLEVPSERKGRKQPLSSAQAARQPAHHPQISQTISQSTDSRHGPKRGNQRKVAFIGGDVKVIIPPPADLGRIIADNRESIWWPPVALTRRKSKDVQSLRERRTAQAYEKDSQLAFQQLRQRLKEIGNAESESSVLKESELIPLLTTRILQGYASGHRGLELGGVLNRRQRSLAVSNVVLTHTSHDKNHEGRRQEAELGAAAARASQTDRVWARVVALGDQIDAYHDRHQDHVVMQRHIQL